MRIAVETPPLSSLPSYNYPAAYDPNKLGLGPLMMQNNGIGNENKWIGPLPVAVARPNEQSQSINSGTIAVLSYSTTKDWVFLGDNATPTANRRFSMYEYDKSNGQYTWKGMITAQGIGQASNATIRALRVTYDKHTAGTVSIASNTVTGTGTSWQTDGACAGNRIGFGSTDPAQITTWYEISTISNNTSMTIVGGPGQTLAAGTPYVIEDLRLVMALTNSAVNSGGLFVIKGLRPEVFSATGTTITMALAADNQRYIYWLADAATVTNTVAFGMAIEDKTSLTSQVCWVLDTLATPRIYKYNLRAALTVASGKSTSALLYVTGSAPTLTGTPTQMNNGRLATLNHGPGAGQKCIYFTTATRVYRTIPVDQIIATSTTFLADSMQEIPPGGTDTLQVYGNITSVDYASQLDMLIVTTNAANTLTRSYLTKYRTDLSQIDRAFGVDTKQTDVTTADTTQTPVPSSSGANFLIAADSGVFHMLGVSSTANQLNRVYAVPGIADWEYADLTNAFIITPKILTPGADKLQSLYVSSIQVLGGTSGKNLGTRTEAFRVKYRTSGIDDNSGAWNTLDQTMDLSGVAGSTAIQFRIEFSTLGFTMVQPRVHAVCVTYDDVTTLTNYQFSVGKSDATSKNFAWRHATAFGGSVPALRVRIYDAVTGGLLFNDTTTSPTYGTWECSTDGGSTWAAWTSADKTNETTYIRYRPNTMGDNITVRPTLTLA